MKFKLLATAALVSTMAMGGAMAQNSGGQDGEIQPDYASDQEQMMYEENADMMTPFFTDDSMSEMRSEEERMAAFDEMDQEQQASMMSLCDDAMQDQDNYGDTTIGICGTVAKGR